MQRLALAALVVVAAQAQRLIPNLGRFNNPASPYSQLDQFEGLLNAIKQTGTVALSQTRLATDQFNEINDLQTQYDQLTATSYPRLNYFETKTIAGTENRTFLYNLCVEAGETFDFAAQLSMTGSTAQMSMEIGKRYLANYINVVES